VDNQGTIHSFDLINFWPSFVPANGLEWVRGVRPWLSDPKLLPPELFLVRRPGDSKQVAVKEDLFLDFTRLADETSIPGGPRTSERAGRVRPRRIAAETPDFILRPSVRLLAARILDFATRHGGLGVPRWHFHRSEDNQPSHGEDFDSWWIEIFRLKDALDLWFAAETGDRPWIRHFLAHRNLLDYPPIRIENPIEYAREIVIQTANVRLLPTNWNELPCLFPGCKDRGGAGMQTDDTRAALRRSKGGELFLVTESSSLLKTLWLQFAASVTGQRKVKKCAAPDCGQYMDVTASKRPAARQMHPNCEERVKKQRYRRRKAEKQA
jgi:hypothetical protein